MRKTMEFLDSNSLIFEKQSKTFSMMNQSTVVDYQDCKGNQIHEDELYERLSIIVKSQRTVPGALIPVLQTAQNLFGYLPEKALRMISKELKITLQRSGRSRRLLFLLLYHSQRKAHHSGVFRHSLLCSWRTGCAESHVERAGNQCWRHHPRPQILARGWPVLWAPADWLPSLWSTTRLSSG